MSTELKPGHPGNRVWVGNTCDEWCILVAASDRREARRMACRSCADLTGMDYSDVLLDLRLHLWRRPNGEFVHTDLCGVAESDEDYALLGFASDEERTWYIADGKPEEES